VAKDRKASQRRTRAELFSHRLTLKTLSAIQAIGDELAITIYALAPEDDAMPG